LHPHSANLLAIGLTSTAVHGPGVTDVTPAS
jgi:hypothetical protein